jgi:hypothetical protein
MDDPPCRQTRPGPVPLPLPPDVLLPELPPEPAPVPAPLPLFVPLPGRVLPAPRIMTSIGVLWLPTDDT